VHFAFSAFGRDPLLRIAATLRVYLPFRLHDVHGLGMKTIVA
jgi:hypothetical protein